MNKIIVNKIGDGTEENPYRPETTEEKWQMIDEQENSFTIELLE